MAGCGWKTCAWLTSIVTHAIDQGADDYGLHIQKAPTDIYGISMWASEHIHEVEFPCIDDDEALLLAPKGDGVWIANINLHSTFAI